MTFAELWLTYQLASRAHLKNSATTQLIDLEFQNHKLIDLEDVLEHDRVVTVFRQGFVEPKFRPSTWWEKGDGHKLKAGHSVEELLSQGVGRTPETSLKLIIQDMPTSLWFTYVYRHNASAPHVAQRVKLAAAASQQGRMDLIAHLTNHIFAEGYLSAKLRSVVHWEGACGKKIEEHFRVEEVLSWDLGTCEEKPLRLIIGMSTSMSIITFRSITTSHPPALRFLVPLSTTGMERSTSMSIGTAAPPMDPPMDMPTGVKAGKGPLDQIKQYYSIFSPPSLSMSELVKTTLDHDETDILIDQWLDRRGHGQAAYHEWFRDIRERKHAAAQSQKKQVIAWNKGDFAPENVFCRTVDTGRLIPLDRTWTTHVYHHQSFQDRGLPMKPVVFTMLPELMLLRGMHDAGCDEIYIIVTDLKRQEMDDVTEYFKMVCRHSFGRSCKPSMEKRIRYEHMRLTHTLLRQRRTPCFPQIDLAVRAILYEKQPRFLVLFSHHGTSYSQIFFTHASYVPDEDIFYDLPTGCPNPCCNDDCEMIRFPRRGLQTASVLDIWSKTRRRRVKTRPMCNWIDCDVLFSDDGSGSSSTGSTEGSEISVGSSNSGEGRVAGQTCSKCKLVKYCSAEHQRKDWEEHRRVCAKPLP
ncbi:hypothetical protein DXG01_008048 [Tephrocybe rancida]|nr:hypothetical protein DXG01_008048 [Tephrocybe rancida]